MARTKANRIAYRSHPCILLFATSQTQSALRPIQTAASSATDFMTLTRTASRKHSDGRNTRQSHRQGADEAKKRIDAMIACNPRRARRLLLTVVLRCKGRGPTDQLFIKLANAKGAGPKRKRSRNVIEVPWHKTPSTRRREVLVPEAGPPQDARPIRSENRAILVASIARGSPLA